MKTVVGIFTSQDTAEQAIERLLQFGLSSEHINLLIPGAAEEQIEAVPTTDTERPGIGKALGAVVGGAIGASGGLFGAAVASGLIPGVGQITAVGFAAAALLGMGGAVAGVAAGSALENATAKGLPKDELFVYEDALRQGRTVVIILTDDATQQESARQILERAGAESLDAAREKWWLGMRDAEAEAYTANGGDFAKDEAVYRQGMEAALQSDHPAKRYEEAATELSQKFPQVYKQDTFRRGYERGCQYRENLKA